LEFGNEVYKIKFPQKESLPAYGCRYWYTLKDAVDNCPEYLVHLETLRQKASQYDLELIDSRPFHDYISDKTQDKDNLQLLAQIKALNETGTISEKEWEALGIYRIFVFRKLKKSVYTRPLKNDLLASYLDLKKRNYASGEIIRVSDEGKTHLNQSQDYYAISKKRDREEVLGIYSSSKKSF